MKKNKAMLSALLIWNITAGDGSWAAIKFKTKLKRLSEMKRKILLSREADLQKELEGSLLVDAINTLQKEYRMFCTLVNAWDITSITSTELDTIQKRREAIVRIYG